MPTIACHNPGGMTWPPNSAPFTCATAMPTTSSPTTAMTAGCPDRAVDTTSEIGKTGCGSSGCRFLSQITIAWSRSSS